VCQNITFNTNAEVIVSASVYIGRTVQRMASFDGCGQDFFATSRLIGSFSGTFGCDDDIIEQVKIPAATATTVVSSQTPVTRRKNNHT